MAKLATTPPARHAWDARLVLLLPPHSVPSRSCRPFPSSNLPQRRVLLAHSLASLSHARRLPHSCAHLVPSPAVVTAATSRARRVPLRPARHSLARRGLSPRGTELRRRTPWPPLAPQRRTAARARTDPQQTPNPLALGPLKLLTPTPSIPLARARRSAARTAAELLLTLRPHLRPFPTPTEHTPG